MVVECQPAGHPNWVPSQVLSQRMQQARAQRPDCGANTGQGTQLCTGCGQVSCLAGLFVAHGKNHVAVDMLKVLLVSKMDP